MPTCKVVIDQLSFLPSFFLPFELVPKRNYFAKNAHCILHGALDLSQNKLIRTESDELHECKVKLQA